MSHGLAVRSGAAYAERLAQLERENSIMAKLNLSRLDFDGLMNLRTQVEHALSAQRSTLERQLERLGGAIASVGSGRGRRRSSLKGQKVAPKYRGPEGELWVGRGARPRWLQAALKTGKKVEDFLIDKAAAATRKVKWKVKRKVKRKAKR